MGAADSTRRVALAPGLEPVLLAWRLSPAQHRLKQGASDERIENAEKILGKRIPRALRAVYQFTDGAEFVRGNLMIDPVLSLARNSGWLRLRGWGIPEEVVVFGGDGSDALYGLWLPHNVPLEDAPVIELGAANVQFESMALAGTSFARLATCRTAYYLLVEDADCTAALDALQLPIELRRDIGTDRAFEAICRWADPGLPRHPPDPYEAPITCQWLQERYGKATV